MKNKISNEEIMAHLLTIEQLIRCMGVDEGLNISTEKFNKVLQENRELINKQLNDEED